MRACRHRSLLRTTLALIFLTLASGAARGEAKDWSFVASAGGLTLGQPTRDSEGHVLLPVGADVSGLHAFSQPPTALNSALVCTGWRPSLSGQQIRLTLETGLPGSEGASSLCPKVVNLGEVAAGPHPVVYADPDGRTHEVGTIQVP